MTMLTKILSSFLFLFLMTFSAFGQDILLLNEEDLGRAVRKEFENQGYGEDVEIEFFGGKTSFVLQKAKLVKIMISNLKIDIEQGTFSSNAEIFADGESKDKTRLSGKYYIRVRAYVPETTIEKGILITEDMLKEISIRANRVKENNIIDKEKLIGLQAKKMLKAGKIVMDREVGQKVLIHKGDVVTVIYKSKGLQITSKAEAQEDGAAKQYIELTNTKSGKSFNARVIDAATVEIDNE